VRPLGIEAGRGHEPVIDRFDDLLPASQPRLVRFGPSPFAAGLRRTDDYGTVLGGLVGLAPLATEAHVGLVAVAVGTAHGRHLGIVGDAQAEEGLGQRAVVGAGRPMRQPVIASRGVTPSRSGIPSYHSRRAHLPLSTVPASRPVARRLALWTCSPVPSSTSWARPSAVNACTSYGAKAVMAD
jgi:hypothetical protein